MGDIEQYKHIDQLIAKSQRVILISSGGKPCLLPLPLKRFGKIRRLRWTWRSPSSTDQRGGRHASGISEDGGHSLCGLRCDSLRRGMDKYVTKAILKDNDSGT